MDSRLGTAVAVFFLAAYAQTTPLFSFISVKPNIALALAVVLALSYSTFFECAILVFFGALGLAPSIGLPQALLFFSAVFILARGVLHAVPWQPFLSGLALVLFFSFLMYVFPDWHAFGRLASSATREALYNATAFAVFYTLMLPRYARKGRYQF